MVLHAEFEDRGTVGHAPRRAESTDLKVRLERIERMIGSYAFAPKGE